jgi:hypothetical protein
MNKKLSLIVCIVSIILLTIFCLFMMYYIKSDGSKCQDNPFLYGASKMKGEISCYCTQLIKDLKVPCPNQFFFNATVFKGLSDCSGVR